MTEAIEVSGDVRVSTLELFFDLVFVFVVTQLVHVLVEPGAVATGHAALELLVVYWMYGGFSWLTNSLGSTGWRQRGALVVGMAVFLTLSLSIPGAFGDEDLLFGVTYLVLTVVHFGAYLLLAGRGTTFRTMLRVAATNLLAAVLVLAAAWVPEHVRWCLWLAAVLVQWLPAVVGLARDFDVRVGHFAERHGLMVIIVLGEALVASVAGARTHIDATAVVGALAGLATATALWWCYFDGEDDAAAEALAGRREGRARAALVGYDLSHVLMIAGVVGVAAGCRLSAADLLSPASTRAAVDVAGGAALYLLGLGLFRLVLGHREPWRAVAGAAVLLTAWPVGRAWGTAQALVLIAVLITAMLLAERRLRRG